MVFLTSVIVEQVEQVSAPWWGNPVVAGSFLLVAGAIGGAISWLASIASDRRRAKREDKLRWHQEVRQVTAGVLGLANEYRGLNLQSRIARLHKSKSSDPRPYELEDQGLRAARREVSHQLELRRSELSLIGSREIGQACDEFVDAVFDYNSPNGGRFADVEEHNAASAKVERTKLKLVDTVRNYLDLD